MLEGLTPTDYRAKSCSIITRADVELDQADREILLEALNNPLFSHRNLAEQLTQRGFSIGETSVRKHRSGKCACARKSN